MTQVPGCSGWCEYILLLTLSEEKFVFDENYFGLGYIRYFVHHCVGGWSVTNKIPKQQTSFTILRELISNIWPSQHFTRWPRTLLQAANAWNKQKGSKTNALGSSGLLTSTKYSVTGLLTYCSDDNWHLNIPRPWRTTNFETYKGNYCNNLTLYNFLKPPLTYTTCCIMFHMTLQRHKGWKIMLTCKT